MELVMDPKFKKALPQLLASCGGTIGSMLTIATKVSESAEMDLGVILGPLVSSPGPIRELIETCEETNGTLDLEGLIRHFSNPAHLAKMSDLSVTVASELPGGQIPLAHTLLPLSILDGKHYYDCGETCVELVGLVQVGPSEGSPYAHLASLIWLPDNGLHSTILSEQGDNGVAEAGRGIERISYEEAPILRTATKAAAQQLYGKG